MIRVAFNFGSAVFFADSCGVWFALDGWWVNGVLFGAAAVAWFTAGLLHVIQLREEARLEEARAWSGR